MMKEHIMTEYGYREIAGDEDLSIVHPNVFARLKEVISKLDQAKTIREFRRGARDLDLLTKDVSIALEKE